MLLEEGDVVLWKNRRYHILRMETVWMGEVPCYRKAELRLCSPEEVEE